jgi:hypothetical protein
MYIYISMESERDGKRERKKPSLSLIEPRLVLNS